MDDIVEMGRDAFKALDVNRADYQAVVDAARKKCLFHGDMEHAWLRGFDDEFDRVKDSLRAYADSFKY